MQALGPDNAPVYMSPGAAVRREAHGPMRSRPTSNLDGDNYLGVGPRRPRKRGSLAAPTLPAASSTSIRRQAVPRPDPAARGNRRRDVGRGRQGWHVADGDRQWRRPDEQSASTDLQRQEAEAGRAVSELSALFNTLRPDDLGVAGNINEVADELWRAGASRPGAARRRRHAARSSSATTLEPGESARWG